MAAHVLVMPGSPALVEELAPRDREAREIISLVRQATGGDDCPIELVGSRDPRWHTARTGSFAAWGAGGVDVGAGNYLPELIQRYALGPEARRVASCRDTLLPINPHALTVVAVDGSAGLHPRAPLTLLGRATWADEWCRAVLAGRASHDAGADAASAARLRQAGVIEPRLWLELAALTVRGAEVFHADAVGGVGRYLALLHVSEENCVR